MLRTYVVAAKLPVENEDVQVIKRSECIPGLWEPITGADTEEEATALAEKINQEGGARAWLEHKKKEMEAQQAKLGEHLSKEEIERACEAAKMDCDSCTLGELICPKYVEGGYDEDGYQRVCYVDDEVYEEYDREQ